MFTFAIAPFAIASNKVGIACDAQNIEFIEV